MRCGLASLVVAALAACACRADAPAAAATTAAEAAAGEVRLGEGAREAARLGIEPARSVKRVVGVVAAGTLALEPKRVAKVGSLVEGRVVAAGVVVGDRVKARQPLATLESVTVGRARADWLTAEARLRRAEKELAREKALVADRASTERVLLQAETEHEVARFEARAATERLRSVGADPGALAQGGSTSTLALTTPLAGTVLEARARVGEAISPADTLFVVADASELWLLVEVYERDLARVRRGDRATVSVVALPGASFEGRVDHVHDTVDPVRHVVDVRIVLSNPEGLLRPGMSATARLEATGGQAEADAGTPPEVVVVRRTAIATIDGLPNVFVEKEPGTYLLRPVELGAALDADVEVQRGLAAGERVVVDGAFLLKSEVLREQMGKND